jgi:hypothetical protein
MSPATLAALDARMERAVCADRAGVDLVLLDRILLARARARTASARATWERTIRMVQDVDAGTCSVCLGHGHEFRPGLYCCGCDEVSP